MKKKLLKTCGLAVVCIAWLAIFTGCERNVTKNAGMDGMTLIDSNGRKWLAKHSIGDCYFLYRVQEDGSVDF